MIRNYFKFAIRGFWKHKLFTLINIFGLSIGISTALVIYLVVHFDFTFDNFHKDGDRIYRVVSNYAVNGEEAYTSASSGALPAAAEKEVTGIEQSAPFHMLGHQSISIPNDQAMPAKFKEQDNIIFADERYLNLFQYQWLAGSAKTALNGINQVVLTSERAKLYFPNLSYEQMLGKIVAYDTLKTTVTGIVKTLPGNTDLTFHDFISYKTFEVNKNLKHILTNWSINSMVPWSQYFIKLSTSATIEQIEKQLNELLKKNSPAAPKITGNNSRFRLQPLTDLHFNEKYKVFYNARTGNKTTLYSLMIIATLLLLLGCINFINLTTAKASQRGKEIGILKTLGSNRKQLIAQFLLETCLLTILSVILSVALTPVLLHLFSDFIPAGVRADFLRYDIISFLIVLTVIVSLVSGIYPAILLSSYKPLTALKNHSNVSTGLTRSALLRKALTVSQFAVAQFFIMATLLVSKQIYYALHKDLGYKKDAIIIINTPWQNRSMQTQNLFRDQLLAIPQIKMISMGLDAPASENTDLQEISYNKFVYYNGKKEISTDVLSKCGDENYIKIYNLKLLQGRNLQSRDTLGGMLINETFAKTLEFKNPADAIGKSLNDHGRKMLVVGVVADFYQSSLHAGIMPVSISTGPGQYFNRVFHIALNPQTANGGDWQKAIRSMEQCWKQRYPDQDFNYHFFDEDIARFYESEQRTSTLLSWTTGLAILISCLGLLGLIIHTTNQRTKEIGIRKVVGASVIQIVTLLSKELVLLIILAFAIITPIAWFVMNKWMQSFADRTTISWWIFGLSGAGIVTPPKNRTGKRTKSLNFNQSNNEEFYYHRSTDCKGHQRV